MVAHSNTLAPLQQSKGEQASLPEGVTCVAPKELAKLAAEGQLAMIRQYEVPQGKDPGSSLAITNAAVEAVTESGKVCAALCVLYA
jgi:hypothetical protein